MVRYGTVYVSPLSSGRVKFAERTSREEEKAYAYEYLMYVCVAGYGKEG